jgi:hypothetical protein
MTTFSCILLWVLLPLIVLGAVITWLEETPADRARRWHRAGVSQRQIALRLQVSRHRVKAWVTA